MLFILPAFALPVVANDEAQARLDRLERENVRRMIEERLRKKESERLRTRSEGRPDSGAQGSHGHVHNGYSGQTGHGSRDSRDGHKGQGYGIVPDVLISGNGLTLYAPSIAIDTALYHDDGDQPLERRLAGLRGFGHAHGDDHAHEDGGDSHAHSLLENGFNLRHAELGMAATADGFGRALVSLNGSEDGVELEEAYVQTERFGGIVDLRLGQFASGYGFTNALHGPGRAFADRELASRTILGDHGLRGLGVQVTAIAPGLPFELGFEAFEGGEETLFSHVDGAGDTDKPGVFVGWVKGDVPIGPAHSLSLGLAGGIGEHQEVQGYRDEGHNHGHSHSHSHGNAAGQADLLDGDAWFVAPSLAYRYDSGGERGDGELHIDAEYIYRAKDLDKVDRVGGFEAQQDGLTISALYGLAPGLRVGARYEHIGLVNSTTETGFESVGFINRVEFRRTEQEFDNTWRVSGLLSYDLTPYARLGAQASYGEYDFENERDEVLQILARLTIQFGSHLH